MAKTITAEPRKIKKPAQRATRKGRTKAGKAGGGAKLQARDKRKDVTAPLVEGENGKTRKATRCEWAVVAQTGARSADFSIASPCAGLRVVRAPRSARRRNGGPPDGQDDYC